jgi:hypothetical protein
MVMSTQPYQQHSNAELFAGLAATVHAEPDRRGHIHVACPECGKEARRGTTHFSFSERGGHCFVCGYSASLWKLAEALQATPMQPARIHQIRQEPPRPRHWQSNPQAYLDVFLGHPERLQLWQAYKPLTIDTIARWQLGVGILPSSQCQHRRLIYPVKVAGQIVGFRGRALTCGCPKWLTAGGSQTVLFGLELVTPQSTVIVVENPVDAILASQVEPSIVAVASTAGATTWRQEWTAELAARRPELVLVWLDHDLAGNGSRWHHAEMVAAWQARNPKAKHPPVANGPRIANVLREVGIRAVVYEWPKGTPAKYDIGSALAAQVLV